MNILIVGSSSFVGSAFAEHLRRESHIVTGLQRRPENESQNTYKKFSWTLGSSIPEEALTGTDWVIFCAHDVNSPDVTRTGHLLMLDQLNKHPGIKCIFISSYSAFKDAYSTYGKIKYELETEFLNRNHYVVRPGLVAGAGGMFLDLYTSILKYPIVPIIGFQNAPIFTIGIDDLYLFIKKIIETSPKKKDYNATYKVEETQLSLAKMIKSRNKKKLFYLRLPIFVFEWALVVGDVFKINLPISKENIQGYKKNTLVKRQSDISFLEATLEPSLKIALSKLKL